MIQLINMVVLGLEYVRYILSSSLEGLDSDGDHITLTVDWHIGQCSYVGGGRSDVELTLARWQ